MRNVIRYLEKIGYNTIDPKYYDMIALWGRWYAGRVPSVHNYQQFNGLRQIRRTRKTLGMAKKVCEDWANLLLNEKVGITADNETINEKVGDVLEANRFGVFGNQLIEKTFAFGTGAFVEYTDGDDVVVDYIIARSIFPLTWDNGFITECAFASERKVGKDKFIYLNIHVLNERGEYVIINKYLRVGKGGGITEDILPDGVMPEVETHSSVPRFQILYPNIANNVDLDSPLGLSVYANALDQLETCDVLFDSFYNEFNLGRKRIMIPLSMVQRMMSVDGTAKMPVFDENDVAFYAYETGDPTQKIDEMNGELRIEAHTGGLDTAVNLVGYKCGFGEHKYKFDKSGTVKTAKEVISEDSDMFRSVRKHEAVIQSAISGLYKAVADLLGLPTDFDVTVDFDDSIIEDTAAEQTRDRQDVQDGIMSKVEYRMKWYHEDEETAKAKLAGIGDVDTIMGFSA